ncbi:MAG: TylF/MycF/NovP-related O-methyltransferase [Thermodesulfobacteriota bacterium]
MQLQFEQSKLIRKINKIRTKINDFFLPVSVKQIIDDVQKNRLTYLSDSRLKKLAKTCLDIESNKIKGSIIEAGCALGGSSIVITASKSKKRKLMVYDIFATIPPPSEKDGHEVHERYKLIASGDSKGLGEDIYYGYIPNLYEKVANNFEKLGLKIDENNVTLIKGFLEETLIINEPVCMAHIDVDWYKPVYLCLERIDPWLTVGGSFIVDDYFDWSGCKRAVNEFFRDISKKYSFDFSAGSMIITKLN